MSKERKISEIALAVDILFQNLKPLEPDQIKENLKNYSYLEGMFGELINQALMEKKFGHYLLNMLNANFPYLKRLDLLIKEMPDVVQRREIRHSIRDNGDKMYDGLSELEIAYYFQKKFDVQASNRQMEQNLYPGSKKIDYKFHVTNTFIWIEVKRFYDTDEARIYNEVMHIDRTKFENNLWDKFQTKFPNINEEKAATISDPVIFAIDIGDSSLIDLEVENFVAGTSVEVRKLSQNGKFIFKETYREDDAMSQRSPITKIISGILLFKLVLVDFSDYKLHTYFIENPFAKNPLPPELIEAFNQE